MFANILTLPSNPLAPFPGDYTKSYGESQAAKQSLRRAMDEERLKGFVDTLVASNIADGINHV